MKKSLQLIVASTMLMVLTNACNQPKSSNPALVGSWKVHALHLKNFDNQMDQLTSEIKSLSDSLAAAKDSASHERFQSQLDQYQKYLVNMTARDSSLRTTKWVFKSDSKFENQESGKSYKGYWDYNPKTKMLTNYLPADSLKIDVKSDTLTVTFDSLNNIIFVKSK